MLSHHNEQDVLRQLAEGDQPAFETIYNQYFSGVFYFALRYLPDSQAAQDITTETFLKLWEKRGDFENLHKLQSFLYTTTRNACINAWRAEKRQSEKQEQLSYLLEQTSEDAPGDQEITAQIFQYIYEEIEKLPAQEKKIFKLAYIEGYSNEEIAQQLEITNQSVRNSKTRALKTMRLRVKDKDIYKFLLLLMVCRG